MVGWEKKVKGYFACMCVCDWDGGVGGGQQGRRVPFESMCLRMHASPKCLCVTVSVCMCEYVKV